MSPRFLPNLFEVHQRWFGTLRNDFKWQKNSGKTKKKLYGPHNSKYFTNFEFPSLTSLSTHKNPWLILARLPQIAPFCWSGGCDLGGSGQNKSRVWRGLDKDSCYPKEIKSTVINPNSH